MTEEIFADEYINSLLAALLQIYCAAAARDDVPLLDQQQSAGAHADAAATLRSQAVLLEADFTRVLERFIVMASWESVRRFDWLDQRVDKVQDIAQECMVRVLMAVRNCRFPDKRITRAYIRKVCHNVALTIWQENWQFKPQDIDDPAVRERLPHTGSFNQDHSDQMIAALRSRSRRTEDFISTEVRGDHDRYVRRRRSIVLLHMAFLTFGGRGYDNLAIGAGDLAGLFEVGASDITDDHHALNRHFGFAATLKLTADLWSELTGITSRLILGWRAVDRLVGWDSKQNRDFIRPHQAAVLLQLRCLELLRDQGTNTRRTLYSLRKGDPYVDDPVGSHHLYWSLAPSAYPNMDRLIVHGVRY